MRKRSKRNKIDDEYANAYRDAWLVADCVWTGHDFAQRTLDAMKRELFDAELQERDESLPAWRRAVAARSAAVWRARIAGFRDGYASAVRVRLD